MARKIIVSFFCLLASFGLIEQVLLAENAKEICNRCPLTGCCISEEMFCNKVTAVMIDNHPGALPQSGLQDASLVFEALMEREYYTRLCALYCHLSIEKIGPIRSVRPYFLDITCGYDAIIAHFGHSPHALTLIQDEHIPSLDGTRAGLKAMFIREPLRECPHNVYTSTKAIDEFAGKRSYLTHQLPSNFSLFDFQDHAGDYSLALYASIYINFSEKYVRTLYTYDQEIKKYKRFVRFGTSYWKPHLDAETDDQISTTNVLVLIAATSDIPGDPEGRLNIQLQGEGEGVCFSQGSKKSFIWKKEGLWSPLMFYEIDKSTQLKLAPGNTWISIVSDDKRFNAW